MQGFITIHRQIMESAVYKDSNAVHLWLHLLLKCNHKDNDFIMNGNLISVKRGQTVTGRKALSVETGIQESKIERLLKLFEKLRMIEQHTNNRNRLITVLSYDKFQAGEQQVNNTRTTDEQLVNTNNNDNKEKKVNNKHKEETAADTKKHKIPYMEIKTLWNELCPDLKGANEMTPARRKKLKALWDQKNDAGDYPYRNREFYERWFTYCNTDMWYRGDDPQQANSDWKASLEFCLNYEKIISKQES